MHWSANVHDAAGNIIQKTDARGVVSTYTYDALNRLTAIEYPSDWPSSAYFYYDEASSAYSKGRVSSLYYGESNVMLFTYDAYGNLKTQNDWVALNSGYYRQFNSGYGYDNANRVQRVIYHPTARRTIYTRNALGQITQVQTQDNASAPLVTVVSNISYQPFGPIKALTFGNGVTTTMAHDGDYQVARIATTSIPAWDYEYDYDPAGNILSQTDQIGTASKSFEYDALDRITLDSFGGAPYGYLYDAGGNRINGGFAFLPYSQTYAATSNRLTQLSSSARSSDAAGNLQMDSGGGALTYDAANRLKQWSKSGVTVNYHYNGLGWRNAKQQGSALTHYDYTPDGKLLAQVKLNADSSFNQIIEYLWLDDLPIAQIKTTYGASNAVTARRLTYIHADHLNTPRLMTDANKTVVWKWHSDAYGMVAPNANSDGDGITDTLDLRFAGQIADAESGLYYNMHRYYDPMLGRYTQSDPIGLRGGLNTYGYVKSNPLRFIDPFGLECECPGATSSGQAACKAWGDADDALKRRDNFREQGNEEQARGAEGDADAYLKNYYDSLGQGPYSSGYSDNGRQPDNGNPNDQNDIVNPKPPRIDNTINIDIPIPSL